MAELGIVIIIDDAFSNRKFVVHLCYGQICLSGKNMEAKKTFKTQLAQLISPKSCKLKDRRLGGLWLVRRIVRFYLLDVNFERQVAVRGK